MILLRTIFICAVLLASPGALATELSSPSAFSCPVTSPENSRPPQSIDPFDKDASLHHQNGLWVTIPGDGIIELAPEDAITFGPLLDWRSDTVTWLREGGVEGFVDVTGKRLDKESDLTPQTPLSPQRQYVRIGPVTTGLAFPSEGCWEVTGSVGEHEISWVVDVRFVEESEPAPEPYSDCRPSG